MKVIVAYDTVHGSTRQVAEAMAQQIELEGHQAELVFVRERGEVQLKGDALFIGSPTRAGAMTKEAQKFMESLDVDYWKDKRIVTFDTLGPISKDPGKRRQVIGSMSDSSKTAATKMKRVLEERGLRVSEVMHFAVIGMWGPAAPDAPELAKEQTHKFLARK